MAAHGRTRSSQSICRGYHTMNLKIHETIATGLVLGFRSIYSKALICSKRCLHFGLPFAYLKNTDASQFALMVKLSGAITTLERKKSGLIMVRHPEPSRVYSYVSYLHTGNGILLMSPLLFLCSNKVISNIISLHQIVTNSYD